MRQMMNGVGKMRRKMILLLARQDTLVRVLVGDRSTTHSLVLRYVLLLTIERKDTRECFFFILEREFDSFRGALLGAPSKGEVSLEQDFSKSMRSNVLLLISPGV